MSTKTNPRRAITAQIDGRLKKQTIGYLKYDYIKKCTKLFVLNGCYDEPFKTHQFYKCYYIIYLLIPSKK